MITTPTVIAQPVSMLLKTRASKQTGPRFQVKTDVSTGMDLLNSHCVQFTVDNLNRFTVEMQVVVIRLGVRRHVTATGSNEAHPFQPKSWRHPGQKYRG